MSIKKSILAAIVISTLTPGMALAAFCAPIAGGLSLPMSVSCGSTSGVVSGDGPTDTVRAVKQSGAAGKRVRVRGRNQFGGALWPAPRCQAESSVIGSQSSNNGCQDNGGGTFSGVLGQAES
jgi:hypothetical protein